MSLLEDARSVNPERRDLEHLGKVLYISLIHVTSLTRAQGTDFENWDDPNFNPTTTILQDESPYIELQSAVANTDNPMIPSSTSRAWVLGIIWAVLIPGVNQFFFFRYPSGQLSAARLHWPLKLFAPALIRLFQTDCPLLLTYPICKAWAHYLLNVSLFGMSLQPWTIHD